MPKVTIEEDLLARIDTAVLWQPFVERVNTMLNACAARGYFYAGLTGFRSREAQDELYAIGRTTGKIGHIVTKVRGGQSRHQHYCAIDFGRDADRQKPGLQYLTKAEDYRVLAEEAVRVGLEAGFYWADEGRDKDGFQDPPHIEAPVKRSGIKTAELEAAYLAAYVDEAAIKAYMAQWMGMNADEQRALRHLAEHAVQEHAGRAAVIALLDARVIWPL